MSPMPFDWSRLIADISDESFGIPFDVVFQIVENGELHEVKAHKMILGMVSPTFKALFYSTDVEDKTARVIKIEKTTRPAFQIMMDAVYNTKSIRKSLIGKSVQEVFDVVNLVERYQIPELMKAAKQELDEYPITDDTVLKVAEEAMEYTSMFEAEANDLLLTCARFLKSKLKDLNSVMKYAAENKNRKEVWATLLALMNDIQLPQCPNHDLDENHFKVTDDGEEWCPNHDLVYGCIRKNMDDAGLHKDQLFRQIKAKMSKSEMETSLQFLSAEGHIYCTVDENHFKATDDGEEWCPNHDLVYGCIRKNMDDAGLHKDQLLRQIKAKMSRSEMETSLEFLSGEGHIYNTVDENHFEVTCDGSPGW